MKDETDLEIDLKTYLLTNHCKYYNLHGKPNRIFLIGLMGSGKTTLSEKLAKEFDYDVFHTDDIWNISRYIKKLVQLEDNQIDEFLMDKALSFNNTLIEGGSPITFR